MRKEQIVNAKVLECKGGFYIADGLNDWKPLIETVFPSRRSAAKHLRSITPSPVRKPRGGGNQQARRDYARVARGFN